MIGANRSIFGCSSSRRKPDVYIFNVPQGDHEWSSKRKESIICAVTKDRVVDKTLRGRIMKKIYFRLRKPLFWKWTIKYIYKLITSLFLSLFKSLKVPSNPGRQGNYILLKRESPLLFPSPEQVCLNFLIFLNFVLA